MEKKLAVEVQNMTLDEVAVISYGLFRSLNHPGTLLSKAIAERIEEGISSCNDVQTSVFAKFLHYSGRRGITENVKGFLEKCIPVVERVSGITAVHMCCAGITVNVENTELINRTMEKIIGDVSSVRLKDMERLLLACLYANIRLTKESDLIRTILKFVKERSEEIKKHPKSFLSLLQYLIMYEVFLEDQINFAMSEEFYQLLPKSSMRYKLREYLFIDMSVKIERPDYKGNKLTGHQIRKIEVANYYKAVGTASWRINKEIMQILQEMYGEDKCVYKSLLPHYDTRHPVVCFNEEGVAEKIGEKLQHCRASIVRAPEDGNRWLSFILARRQACLSDGITPNLVSEAKFRHFRAVGYIPVVISVVEWHEKTPDERPGFLRGLIEKAMDNVSC